MHLHVQLIRKKWLLLRFRGYLGEIESDSQTVWTSICAINMIVPRSVLPIFKS